jgi:spermidine synthase
MVGCSKKRGMNWFHPLTLGALALFSGGCALAYEVLYLRALTTVFGDMFYVHAALLSMFLVGVGFGAKVASRYHRFLPALEIATGAYAFALPGILKWLSFAPFLDSVVSSPTLTILFTAGLIASPGVMIGFSIPLFSGYIKAVTGGGPAFRFVYWAYNLGALMAILIVEFVMLRKFGVQWSLLAIGCLNIFNGLALLALNTSSLPMPKVKPRRFERKLLVALGMASFASACFQMFLLKLSYLVFHPHRENFAVILAVTLLGICLGNWIAMRFRLSFETLTAAIPVAIGLVFAAYLPILAAFQHTAPMVEHSELLIFVHKLSFGCVYGLAPLTLFGALIPALMRQEGAVEEESGLLLWVSGCANAAGYLAFVLILHPFLSAKVLLLFLALLGLAASFHAVSFRLTRFQAFMMGGGLVPLTLMIICWRDANFYTANWRKELKPEDTVTVFKSGAESATLMRRPNLERVSYNGHRSVIATENGRVNFDEVVVGIIPALSAPRREEGLVLALGTGISAGAMATFFSHTDVVEINRGFLKMMLELGHANFGLAENLSAEIHIADGRTFLIGKENRYDAILNSIPSPVFYSASKIYTVEFYERIVQALKPDGVFCTWFAVGDFSEEGTLTVLSALRKHFLFCDLRMIRQSYYMVTCSNRRVKPRRFSELNASPAMLQEIADATSGIRLDELFEDMRLSPNVFDHFTPIVARENTDDHPVLEFLILRRFRTRQMGSDFFISNQDRLNIDALKAHEPGDFARIARRAAIFNRFGPEYFQQWYLPLLQSDTNVWVEWEKITARGEHLTPLPTDK